MQRRTISLILLSVNFWACGPNAARMNSGANSSLASDEVSGTSKDSGDPSHYPSKSKDPSPQKLPVTNTPAPDTVAAPVPVSGTFLVAKVLDKETLFTDSMTIGLVVYKDGMRVGSDTNRFALDISLDELASPHVKVRKDLLGSQRGYDKEIRIYGNSLAEIEATFGFIQVKFAVNDRMSSLTSAKTQTLSELLNP